MNTHLFVSMPTFGGIMHTQCAHSVMNLTHALRNAGIGFTMDYVLHESLIQRARNMHVMHFLACTQATHMLFVDADIVFRAEDVLAMLKVDKPVVCGAYPKKGLNTQRIRESALAGAQDPLAASTDFAINRIPGKWTSDDGCVPILDAATGFLLLKRHVLLDMIARYPETAYASDNPQNRGAPMWSLFDCMSEGALRLWEALRQAKAAGYDAASVLLVREAHDAVSGSAGRYLSEDYTFSRRWQAMGGEVFLYLGAELGHIGSHVYRGVLDSLYEREVVPDTATEFSDIPTLADDNPQKVFHLDRHKWAAERIKGHRIANAPCGTAYGNDILLMGQPERWVVGFDRSKEALELARKYLGEARHTADLEGETLDGFDTLVCLEGWEHLKDPRGWFSRLSPTVKEALLSVPIVKTTHYNKFHLRDWSEPEIVDAVTDCGWRITELGYQREFEANAVLLLRAERA